MPNWTVQELIHINKALEDPVYFAENPFFLGQTLYPKQREVFRLFYKGNPDTGTPYRELVMMLGRQSGKTFLTSVFALYETFRLIILDDPAKYYGLAPGSKIFILAIAASETQAKDTIYSAIQQKMVRCPFFRRFNPKIYSLEIRFDDQNVYIFCGTTSAATMVGRTVKLVIIDEIAKIEEGQTSRVAWNVYNSLARSTVLFGYEGKRIMLSTPIHTDDIICTLYERTQQYDDMLGLKFPTWEFNPRISYDDPEMQRELEKDPIAFWTDYGVRPIAITEFYFGNREILRVDDTKPNLLEYYFNGLKFSPPPHMYVLTGDPALKHDAFGLALGHLELDTYYVDGLWAFRSMEASELDPLRIRDDILGIVSLFNPVASVFDTWAFPETQAEIQRRGIPVYQNIVDKECYDKVKDLFYHDKLLICPYPGVLDEFKNLRLIRGKKVDHPRGGSKDIADSVANLVWACDNVLAAAARPVTTGITI